MIWSLVFAVLYGIFAVIVAYAYIRLAVAKEKENKLLKEKMDFDSLKSELKSYKTAVKVAEMYFDREDGKRVGFNYFNDEILGILSRLGFTLNSIKDIEEHKGKKEINFKLNGKDLVESFNRHNNNNSEV